MPDGSHTTVRLPDTALATEVLEKVSTEEVPAHALCFRSPLCVQCCSKRKFEPDRYHLEFIDDGENVPDATTVEELKERAVELVANSEIAGLDTYMSDRKAMQYEVFKVIKIKKGFKCEGEVPLRGLGCNSPSLAPTSSRNACSALTATVFPTRRRRRPCKTAAHSARRLMECAAA